eukprot:gnl/MRDRNA2_/MRDRNA2_55724_c0_seq1.p1 gnl/MRDRNA2_/MRDRNA2_55724_c0~~gnl/MRDRNA2_/MRDRNA2_55724_c0_seq1.p1  ORF type:complete len:1050 (+),score=227.70 gnl/MRDRNA2_/MRDRNA2_55724_c0_seq1:179-3328(+)
MPRICDAGGKGVLLPLIEDESEWSNGLRAVLYFVGLLYLFMGVGIVSDVFMSAIEEVTSKKKRVRLSPGDDRMVTVNVWNETVANLSLMALGSSAPEILLSVIELLGNDFFAGELGPSTIVGSAAFNQLMIIAVCVYVIPDGELRAVKEVPVFFVTACFSIFAYCWLLIIIVASSPDIVEIWEGVVTFIFFWILIFVAYLADQGYFTKTKPEADEKVLGGECKGRRLSQTQLQQAAEVLKEQRKSQINPDDLDRMLHNMSLEEKHVTRAERRCQAIREMTGGKKLDKQGAGDKKSADADVVQFVSGRYDVNSSGRTELVVGLERSAKDMDHSTEVKYHHVNGTLQAGKHFMPCEGLAIFNPQETRAEIRVEFCQPMGTIGEFTIVLDGDVVVRCPNGSISQGVIGANKTANIVIGHKSSPGVIGYPMEAVDVAGCTEKRFVDVVVERTGGSAGEVTAKYKTERCTAVPGYDYTETEGEMQFADCQSEAVIKVEILPKSKFQKDDTFRVVLEEPTGGATFDASKDGGEEKAILTVNITNSHSATFGLQVIRWFDGMLNFDEIKVGTTDWGEQFSAAIYCNGSPEEQKEAEASDWAVHLLALPWKITFAFIPPTAYFGGWLCFVIALVFIGGVTAIIGDMASLFGCVLGIPDAITAITFVALGTSLPDTFASKTAAIQDDTADASVGNVTGSNSVNVFLGIGLPWTMGAAYWVAKGPTPEWEKMYPEQAKALNGEGRLVVIAGDLAFSVTVFTLCCLLALGTLVVRRKAFGGELGGPRGAKTMTAAGFCGLWFYYIGLASWQSLQTQAGNQPSSGDQVAAIVLGLACMALLILLGALCARNLPGAGESESTENLPEASKQHAVLAQKIGAISMGQVDSKELPEVLTQARADLEAQEVHLKKWEGMINHFEVQLEPSGANAQGGQVPATPPPESTHPPLPASQVVVNQAASPQDTRNESAAGQAASSGGGGNDVEQGLQNYEQALSMGAEEEEEDWGAEVEEDKPQLQTTGTLGNLESPKAKGKASTKKKPKSAAKSKAKAKSKSPSQTPPG